MDFFPLHTLSHLDLQLKLFSELGLSLKARQEGVFKLQDRYDKPLLRSASTVDWQPSAEGGGRRENCCKNKVPSNISTNYLAQKLEPKTIIFLVISLEKPQVFFMPPNTFKLHSKLGLWVWKSFFANLLYMNACRSFWMLNAVGGLVSMVTLQWVFFLHFN